MFLRKEKLNISINYFETSIKMTVIAQYHVLSKINALQIDNT